MQAAAQGREARGEDAPEDDVEDLKQVDMNKDRTNAERTATEILSNLKVKLQSARTGDQSEEKFMRQLP